MSAGTVVAGLIALFLGAAGLLELYGRPILPFSIAIVSAFITPFGALVLFGVIALIGLGLIVGGLVWNEHKVVPEVRKEVIIVSATPQVIAPVVAPVVAPVAVPVAYETLSDLEITILRYLSEGKEAREISKLTGVAHQTISEKLAKLNGEGYITEKHALTEKGFEALRRAGTQPPYPRPNA